MGSTGPVAVCHLPNNVDVVVVVVVVVVLSVNHRSVEPVENKIQIF